VLKTLNNSCVSENLYENTRLTRIKSHTPLMHMTGKDDFRQLMEACRQRDPIATAELVRRYLPHIRAAVRRKLAVELRGRFDSLDFAQDVWYSFFRLAMDRNNILSEKALIAYLSEMARLKVFEEYRHQTTKKIGLRREIANMPLGKLDNFEGHEPTPSTNAIADDEWEKLVAGLPERESNMLRMLREGHTHAATAAAFGMSEKTVQRLVQRLLDRGAPPGTPL
jgi:RNA polymerase sigma factor (sigma-70 family)